MRITHIAYAMSMVAIAVPAGQAIASGVGGLQGVSFVQPHDGTTVPAEFKVKMDVQGMRTHPAGEIIKGTGHHHLIVDGGCIAEGSPVPKNATHKHFGKGQSETMLNLTPGRHTLTLQFANGLHQSYGNDWCATISIDVE